MKKWIAILLVAVMALSVVACARKKDEKKDDAAANAGQTQNNEQQQPAPTVEPAPAPKTQEELLVGTWEYDIAGELAQMSEDEKAMMEAMGITADNYQIMYVFNADGTGTASMKSPFGNEDLTFTYTAKNGRISMTATYEGETSTTEGTFKIEDNKLTLTSDGGETQVFNRK